MVDWAFLFVKLLIFLFIFLPRLLFAQSELKSSYALETKNEKPQFNWYGDIRFRAQNETSLPGQDRLSEKLRVRLGVKIPINSSLRSEIRLATSRSNNSTNQTLGDNKEPGMSRRFMGLDLAYAEWKPLFFARFQAGRLAQVHEKPGGSQIILDSDLALEGAAIITDYAFDSNWSFRTNWGSSWIRENYDSFYSEEQGDNMLNWGQIVLDYKLDTTKVTGGFGFFNFTSLQGKKFTDISTGGSARGNSQEPVGSYKDNYIPRQYFLDVKTEINSWVVGAFAEYIVNSETLDPNRASWIGTSIGLDKWIFQIAYATLDTDPVPGIFTDSDFAGGTTDSRGYVLNLKWKIYKGLDMIVTQFHNFKRTELGDMRYDRVHLDLNATF